MFEEGFSLQGTVYDFLWDREKDNRNEQVAYTIAQTDAFFYALSIPFILDNFSKKDFSEVTKNDFIKVFDKVDSNHRVSADKYDLYETCKQVDMIHQIIGLFDKTFGNPEEKQVKEMQEKLSTMMNDRFDSSDEKQVIMRNQTFKFSIMLAVVQDVIQRYKLERSV